MTRPSHNLPTSQNNRKQLINNLLILGISVGLVVTNYVWIHQRHRTDLDSESTVVTQVNTTEAHIQPTNSIVPLVISDSVIAHDVSIPPVVNGLAPIISRLETKKPVVFLGIDDGVYKQAFELRMMKDYHVKASLFLANSSIKDNPSFFKDFVAAGSLVEDHTIEHKLLSGLSYDEQKQEICGEADLQFQQFGRRPVIFRPPGGDYNTNTQRAAAACGMRAVVLWMAKANGGSMQYQIGNSLKPGDIVLMHFRPEFAKDMQSFLDAEKAAGLHTELLEDWLP
jgi:peptidoglycan/xylan/chitin deacetylase (PgdA/CDA1 family)